MLKSGLYKAEHNGDIFHAYQYLMEVKVTEKSYVFNMIEKKRDYADDKIELLFGAKNEL